MSIGATLPKRSRGPQQHERDDRAAWLRLVRGWRGLIRSNLEIANTTRLTQTGQSLARSLLTRHLTRACRHPYTIHADGVWMVIIMADNVHELRPKPADTEKITINLGYVDLGHVDLMVQEGFYSNRSDFISNGNRQPARTSRRRGQAVHGPKRS